MIDCQRLPIKSNDWTVIDYPALRWTHSCQPGVSWWRMCRSCWRFRWPLTCCWCWTRWGQALRSICATWAAWPELTPRPTSPGEIGAVAGGSRRCCSHCSGTRWQGPTALTNRSAWDWTRCLWLCSEEVHPHWFPVAWDQMLWSGCGLRS